jgi:hypothetical protein
MNHTTKRKVWRVKGKGKEEGVVIVQGPRVVEYIISANEVDNKLLPKSKAIPIQILSSIAQ